MSVSAASKARLKSSAAYAAPRRAQPRAERIALPHRAAMVSRYGGKAAHLPVFAGPAVEAVLKRRGAEGAALDGVIFLPGSQVPADLVAHEVVHALQQPLATGDGDALLSRLETAVAAPEKSPVEREAAVLSEADGAPPSAEVLHSLPAGVVALRRTGSGGPDSEHASPAPPEQPRTAEQAGGDAAAAAPPAEAAQAEPASGSAARKASASEIAPTFSPPPLPETALDPAVAAEREAARAEAEAALAAADSPSAIMDAYAAMAPSVKGLHSAELGTRVAQANESSARDLQAATPEMAVKLSGEESNLPSPPPIELPGDRAGTAVAALADPEVDVPGGPAQPELRPDPGYGPQLERVFGSGASPEMVDQQLDNVSTANPGIQTQITQRGDVPLEGASDPAQMDAERSARAQEARNAQGEAARAVAEGPGPETIVPREMEHSVAITAPQPETKALAQPEGAAQLNQMTLPPEVVARFDEDTGPAMAASAAAARTSMETAESDRDTAHAEAVQQAETDRAAAEQAADAEQRGTIVSNREAIQSERQRTVDQQQAEVDRVNAEAESARAEHGEQADRRIAEDREAITRHYDQAEAESRAEVSRGERNAEAERERAERESENQSWWDRATSFIRRAFEALTSAINAIFDVVRAAVAAIIDAAVSAVSAIIEAAAAALKALISAFGELLKALVDDLLGQIFPELAAALTRFIDAAVNAVNEAVDAIAAGLIAAVEAVGAALNSAINALLDLYQNAINGALALLEAAMTGDWGALLLKVLDAILRVLGIDPAAFHALIAQASNAVDSIVNDPGGFVTNLLDAVVGGIRQFAGNFGSHLRNGLIGWLTGALGGITLPERWDIWGVLDIARQVLGLTWDFVRARAAAVIGEANVARLEAVFSWIGTLVAEGWGGLWNRIMSELESLKDTVMNAIREFILERVIMGAIRWLASLFSPVGALVQLVMTIWNVYQFVSNQLQRLFGIAQAVVEGIANIAAGVLGPAMSKVEEVLGNLVPVVIDLLMSLLGVTGVAARVREIIGNIRASIAAAVDRLIQRILGALGVGQSREAPAAAPAGMIGRPVRVDVAEGEDHTLTVDRDAGGRGATIHLHSDVLPIDAWLNRLSDQASRMRDQQKKARVEGNIAAARRLLGPLDQAADRAAQIAPSDRPVAGSDPAALMTPLETQLAPVLKAIFDDVGTSELLSAYASDIAALPEAMRPTIRREIIDNAERYVRVSGWPAVLGEMKRYLPLFVQPLASGNRGTEALRAQVTAYHTTFIASAEASDEQKLVTAENLLRFMASKVVTDESEAAYSQLHQQLVMVIIGRAAAVPQDVLHAAVAKAMTAIANRGASEVDPALRAAIRGSTVISALTTIANGGTVGDGINEARLEQLWESQANVDHVKDAFRAAMPGRHEWIPSNYILEVVQRSFTPGRANEESAEKGAIWVKVQHEWRTRTEFIIYRPDYSARTAETGQILQGHSGAIYARLDGERATPQTQKQNIWHDELRTIFDRNKNSGGEAKTAVATVMAGVDTFIGRTVWDGTTSAALDAFNRYCTSTADPERLEDIAARGRRSASVIAADFARARGAIGL